jgi:hypothetical protein
MLVILENVQAGSLVETFIYNVGVKIEETCFEGDSA